MTSSIQIIRGDENGGPAVSPTCSHFSPRGLAAASRPRGRSRQGREDKVKLPGPVGGRDGWGWRGAVVYSAQNDLKLDYLLSSPRPL